MPYHRNNRGNRWTFDTLLTDADDAHRRIRDRGVRYVALCLADSDMPRLTASREDSLLNQLAADRPPAWLVPIPARGPIRAWRVLN